jgi:hypothetical protein
VDHTGLTNSPIFHKTKQKTNKQTKKKRFPIGGETPRHTKPPSHNSQTRITIVIERNEKEFAELRDRMERFEDPAMEIAVRRCNRLREEIERESEAVM